MTVNLVLTTSHDNPIKYNTWNERSWKPALASAGLIKVVGEKVKQHGKRARKHPVYEVSREDMYHVLRHTYASVQLEAGESIVSLAEWLGHSSPKVTLDHYAHFMPEAGRRGLAAMDSWLAPNRRGRKVPEKSLAALPVTKLSVNPQVEELLQEAADVKVKYKETARGGLAVNAIEC
ncbi:hypothetical protein [Streptomyces sp. AA1529]|uniref:hypothetical protein n=1 Tax=Streptomyces sp. AA1529 TaxID=1203257 RepID=UPI003D7299D9